MSKEFISLPEHVSRSICVRVCIVVSRRHRACINGVISVLFQGVDFWAFGILIYEMLCGGTPFADEEHSRIFVKIVHSQVEFVLIGFDSKINLCEAS